MRVTEGVYMCVLCLCVCGCVKKEDEGGKSSAESLIHTRQSEERRAFLSRDNASTEPGFVLKRQIES